MGETTARLRLPLLAAGQAQKEMTHNEALALLDAATQAAVEGAGVDIPPAMPAEGQCWIVGAAPTGAWAGQAHALACWTGGGWRFVAATAGMTAWVAPQHLACRYDGSAWRSAAAIPEPAGGATIDAQSRGAIAAVLVALRQHGIIAA